MRGIYYNTVNIFAQFKLGLKQILFAHAYKTDSYMLFLFKEIA